MSFLICIINIALLQYKYLSDIWPGLKERWRQPITLSIQEGKPTHKSMVTEEIIMTCKWQIPIFRMKLGLMPQDTTNMSFSNALGNNVEAWTHILTRCFTRKYLGKQKQSYWYDPLYNLKNKYTTTRSSKTIKRILSSIWEIENA